MTQSFPPLLLVENRFGGTDNNRKQSLSVEQTACSGGFSFPLSLRAPWQHSLWYADTLAICTVQPQGEYWLFQEAESFCINCRAKIVLLFFWPVVHLILCLFYPQMWREDCLLEPGVALWRRREQIPSCKTKKAGSPHQCSLCSSYHYEPLSVASGYLFGILLSHKLSPLLLTLRDTFSFSLTNHPPAMDRLCPGEGASRTQALVGKL